MMKKYILFWVLQAGLLMTAAAQQTAHFEAINKALLDTHSNIVLVAAHRGPHLQFPENSMAGYRKAIELGIDFIELDVRCTKDGKLVLIHDRTVDRTTNGSGPVDSFTFEQIRKLRLKHNGKVTDQQIPTLEEALLLAKGKIMVDMDIKTETCIRQIMETVDQTGMIGNVLFFVYDPQDAQKIKAVNPAYRVLARTHNDAEVNALFTGTTVEAVHIDDSFYSKAITDTIKTHGARVWINALGDVDKKVAAGKVKAFEEVLQYGANIIQTDQPALLKAYLEKTGRYY